MRSGPTPATAMPRRCWRKCGSTSRRWAPSADSPPPAPARPAQAAAHPSSAAVPAAASLHSPPPLPPPPARLPCCLQPPPLQLEEMRKNEDPRLSFSTPEFKEAQRQFTDAFKVSPRPLLHLLQGAAARHSTACPAPDASSAAPWRNPPRLILCSRRCSQHTPAAARPLRRHTLGSAGCLPSSRCRRQAIQRRPPSPGLCLPPVPLPTPCP